MSVKGTAQYNTFGAGKEEEFDGWGSAFRWAKENLIQHFNIVTLDDGVTTITMKKTGSFTHA